MRTTRGRLQSLWAHPATQPLVVFLGLVIGCVVVWFVLSHVPDPGPCGYFPDGCVAESPGRN